MVAQVGYSVAGRSRGRVTPCAVCIVHVETRSMSFLVEPQNQGRWFVSGLASKPLGRFLVGLASKPVVTVSAGLASKFIATVFLWFGFKTSGGGFLQFGLKTGGDCFSLFGLKTDDRFLG
jgi:hypothetical protein